MRASKVPKKKAKIKGRGLRWRLKQIARDYQPAIALGLYLLGDYLQDGAIDGSLLVTLGNMGAI